MDIDVILERKSRVLKEERTAKVCDIRSILLLMLIVLALAWCARVSSVFDAGVMEKRKA